MPESPATEAGFCRILKRKGSPALSALGRIADKSAVQIPCHVHLQVSKTRGVFTKKIPSGFLNPSRARRPIQGKQDRYPQAAFRRIGSEDTAAVKFDHLPGVQQCQA